MLVVYIAGPITGVPNYREKFSQEEHKLTELGFIVLNPAKAPLGLTNTDYMRLSFAQIDVADAVVLLPGWDASKGARLEVDYCQYTGKPVYFSAEGLIKAKEAGKL